MDVKSRRAVVCHLGVRLSRFVTGLGRHGLVTYGLALVHPWHPQRPCQFDGVVVKNINNDSVVPSHSLRAPIYFCASLRFSMPRVLHSPATCLASGWWFGKFFPGECLGQTSVSETYTYAWHSKDTVQISLPTRPPTLLKSSTPAGKACWRIDQRSKISTSC